jgi:hypothetical protein
MLYREKKDKENKQGQQQENTRLNSKTKKYTRGNHQQYQQRSTEIMKAIYINTFILFIFVNKGIYNLFTN